jgi:aldehyde dehydrogenase (NAD+)
MTIAGEAVEASDGAAFETINPFTGESWAMVPRATEEDVRAAIAAARAAFAGWGRSSGAARAQLMHRLADEIQASAEQMAATETTDNGKVLRETAAQMQYVARLYRYYAGWADKIYGDTIGTDSSGIVDHTLREPLGVVALITAWNSPMALLAYKLAPALAAGNTVVVKPSEHASASTLEFARHLEAAGFPAGVVNIVSGGAQTGGWLTSAPGLDKISFTGGPAVGRLVATNAAQTLTPTTLELGGKSANIVFEDADIDRAFTGALAGIFGAAGQTCIAGSRLLVQRGVYEDLVARIAERADHIQLGDPIDPGTEMGPVITAKQQARIRELIDSGVSEGARMVAGQRNLDVPPTDMGYFVAPTVFADVRNDMRVAREEVFGPVLSIIRFDEEEEAIAIANDSPFGLAGGVWTDSIQRAHRVVDAVDAGTMWVNTYRVMAVQGPFGGVKMSGYGRERGQAGLLEYTRLKNVITDVSSAARDPFVIGTGQ